MGRWLAFLILCANAVVAAAALAQDLPSDQRADSIGGLRPLGSADDAAAWSAVGRIDTGASFCSGTLIAPDLVLTAAHCLYHPRTDVPFTPDDLVFSAGLRNGRAEAVREVRRMLQLPGYRPEIGEDLDMIGRDLAVLELQHPIPGASVIPMATGQTGRGRDPMVIVSYGADREAHASIEEGCEVLGRSGAVRSLSCQVVSGSSGSPVLRIQDGRAEVVAVVSATAEIDGDAVSLAVVLDGQLSTLLDQRAGTGAAPVNTTGGTALFLGADNDGRDDIGARFIRP